MKLRWSEDAQEPIKWWNADRVSSTPLPGRIGPAYARRVERTLKDGTVVFSWELGVGTHHCYLDHVGGAQVTVWPDGGWLAL